MFDILPLFVVLFVVIPQLYFQNCFSHQSVKEQNKYLIDEKSNSENKAEELQQRVQQITEEYQTQITTLESNSNQLKEQNKYLIDEKNNSENKAEELQQRVQQITEEYQTQITTLESNSNQLKEQNKYLINEKSNSENKAEELQQRVQQITSKYESQLAALQTNKFVIEKGIQANDKINSSLRAKYDHLNEEIRRLEGYKQKYLEHNRTIILEATEIDFYPHEKQAIILDILCKQRNKFHKDSRREHIVKDIIEHNKDITRIYQDKIDHIEKLFCNYSGKGKSIKTIINELKKLGFELVSDKNHYKFIWNKIDRYCIIISKTPGDNNAWNKIVSNFRNKFF